MTLPTPLPDLMVAPTGARRGKSDHPELPVTLPEILATAQACHRAGAQGLHLHVRDAAGAHSLDPGLYQEATAALSETVPDMFVQITSEAAGRYGPDAQIEVIRALRPPSVSAAVRELVPDPAQEPAAQAFYHWAAEAGVIIQHIVYAPSELARFVGLVRSGVIPGTHHQLQLVLGTYADPDSSHPEDLGGFLDQMGRAPELGFDWMLCAFGAAETACLLAAAARGGKMRVGFENSLWHADGRVARDNADRVRAVLAALEKPATPRA